MSDIIVDLESMIAEQSTATKRSLRLGTTTVNLPSTPPPAFIAAMGNMERSNRQGDPADRVDAAMRTMEVVTAMVGPTLATGVGTDILIKAIAEAYDMTPELEASSD